MSSLRKLLLLARQLWRPGSDQPDEPLRQNHRYRRVTRVRRTSQRQTKGDLALPAAAQLAVIIARCPVAQQCLHDPSDRHPCAAIVRSQRARTPTDFQLPEAWAGDISRAPILFVGSNGSFGPLDDYPRWNWSDALIVDYFTHRFGGGRKQWVRDGVYVRQVGGSFSPQWVRYWAACRARATELLGREARPGIDYALTEAVHCKSRGEVGVARAAEECVPRYLEPVIAASAARVVVCLGRTAEMAAWRQFKLPYRASIVGPITIGSRPRYFAFLPHPNARQPRTFSDRLSAREVQTLRKFLGSLR
jgi:hypothetical protein